MAQLDFGFWEESEKIGAMELTEEELRREAEDLTRSMIARARKKWPLADLPDPRITFNLRGHSAGCACSTRMEVNYNDALLMEHRREFLDQIVPHEVAHLIVDRVHKKRVKPHGMEWREIVSWLGGVPSATHGFATVPARRLLRYLYACNCENPHFLTGKSHRRARRRTVEYTCRVCHRSLEYSGKTERR